MASAPLTKGSWRKPTVGSSKTQNSLNLYGAMAKREFTLVPLPSTVSEVKHSPGLDSYREPMGAAWIRSTIFAELLRNLSYDNTGLAERRAVYHGFSIGLEIHPLAHVEMGERVAGEGVEREM